MNRSPNHLLQRLPAVYRNALLSSAEEVVLPVATVLFEPGLDAEYANFVLSGAVSISSTLLSGDGVELFSVGREGLVEATHLLGVARSPGRAVVQVQSRVARIRFNDFQLQFADYQPLRQVILSYIQRRTFILEQLVACNRHHEVEARVSRWLLMMHDRFGNETFRITQEALADLLGTRRTTVTHVARRLQQEKTIEYARGNLRILNRQGLERRACECYEIVRRIAGEDR